MFRSMKLFGQKSPESPSATSSSKSSEEGKDTSKPPKVFSKPIYVVLWLLLWLVPTAAVSIVLVRLIHSSEGSFIKSVLSQMPAIGDDGTLGLILLAVVVCTLVFLMIWAGIGGDIGVPFPSYKTTIKRHRSIWVSFVFVFLVVFLGHYLNYASLDKRVAALRGNAVLLSHIMQDDQDTNAAMSDLTRETLRQTVQAAGIIRTRHSLESSINMGAKLSGSVKEKLKNTPYPLAISTMLALTQTFRELPVEADQSNQFAHIAHDLVREMDVETASFKGLLYVTGQLVTTTNNIVLSTNDLLTATKLISSTTATEPVSGTIAGEQVMRDLTLKAGVLANYYYQAQNFIAGAKDMLLAERTEVFGMFVLFSVLYAVFLLFPWVLTFMFLLRKRGYLVHEKAELLEKLEMDRDFLDRSKKPSWHRTSSTTPPNATADDDASETDLQEGVRNQAFRNSEYVIGLVLLTIVTGTLWYLVFYPNALLGLARLISQSGGGKALVSSLITSGSPITFGFLGAYFFLVQMFLRRYYAADLNPRAYSFAIVRVLITFILSLTLQLMEDPNNPSNWANLLAFIVGIFPQVGITWILKTGNQILKSRTFPEYMDRYQLTELDGLNTWDEARLFEEKIENIQNLATASLAELIVHTNFSAAQLVDWIDQALLYIYMQEHWKAAFYAVGVRTATDLLDTAGAKPRQSIQFDSQGLVILATAINAAQIPILPDLKDSAAVIRPATIELANLFASVAAAAESSENLSESLKADNNVTLDAVADLLCRLDTLSSMVQKLQDAIKNIQEVRSKLPAASGERFKQVGDRVEQITKLSESLSSIVAATHQIKKPFNRRQPETLSCLELLSQQLGAIWSTLVDLESQVTSTIDIVEQAPAENAGQAEWAAVLHGLKDTNTILEKTMIAVLSARELGDSMDKNQPATLNRIIALQQTLNTLDRATGSLRSALRAAISTVERMPASSRWLAEARKMLDATLESANRLEPATKKAKEAAAALDLDVRDSLTELATVQSLVKSSWNAAIEVKTKGQASVGVLQAMTAPMPITVEILKTIITALATGPNIDYLVRFWQLTPKPFSNALLHDRWHLLQQEAQLSGHS